MMVLKDRKVIVSGIFIAVAAIFLLRLLAIQVFTSKYQETARKNAIRVVKVYPSRGLVYDRNQELLVYNQAAYDLMIVPNKVSAVDTSQFCSLFDISMEEYVTKYKKAKKYSGYKASVFIKEISAELYAKVQEKLYLFPGFYVQTRTLRKYPKPMASHVLGYIREVTSSDLKKDKYYVEGDYIGKSGIEKSYEKQLRGKKGVKRVLVDVHNREKGKYRGGANDTTAVKGNDLVVTLDGGLQAYGEQLMAGKLGSIVAIEPKSGEILSLVSAPSYDPNFLVGRKVRKNFSRLSKDTLNPFFNRALMAQYPPGSIFKTIQALIAMQKGMIDSNASFVCNKALVGCHGHPQAYDVSQSIKMSCNPYYFQVFKRLIMQGKVKSRFKDSELGLSEWAKSIKRFGLGSRPLTDLPNIKNGYVPDVGFYNRWYGEGRWAFSTIYSLSIGQGELGVVPIQMANLAAIIANKGYYYPPHIVREVNGTIADTVFHEKQYVGVDQVYFNPIIEGMRMVVNEPGGTARRASMDSIVVCGKTGTAENPHGKDHSIFIAFAPKDDPKIAIAVYVENAGFGGTWAAPIASLMMEKYLMGKVTSKRKEERILTTNLIELNKK